VTARRDGPLEDGMRSDRKAFAIYSAVAEAIMSIRVRYALDHPNAKEVDRVLFEASRLAADAARDAYLKKLPRKRSNE